ncbi:MAG: hypothetical protein K6T65_16165 [Peptococcaceae bacterium]|nr:hypothetical protein [Peptococcaceae bacterium]
MRSRVPARVVTSSSSLRSFLLARIASRSAPSRRMGSNRISPRGSGWLVCGSVCTGTRSHWKVSGNRASTALSAASLCCSACRSWWADRSKTSRSSMIEAQAR